MQASTSASECVSGSLHEHRHIRNHRKHRHSLCILQEQGKWTASSELNINLFVLSNRKNGHHKLTFPIFRSVILSVFWEKAWSREKKISLDYYFNRKVKVFFETPGEHLENEVKYFRRQTSNNIDIDGEYEGLNANDRNHLVGKHPTNKLWRLRNNIHSPVLHLKS